MLKTFAMISVLLVSLLHFGFMILEATQWAKPLGQKLTHLSEGAAIETVGIGRNMALYNGFIGFALFWVTFALSTRQAYSAQWIILPFIVIAGIYGAISLKNPGIFVFQSVPAMIALGLIWGTRPYPSNDAAATDEIVMIERQILALKSADPKVLKTAEGNNVPRGQHPKLHGLVKATFTIANEIPPSLRFGLFKEPGKSFDALVRYSSARNADDRERGGFGMAVKLLNIDDGSGGATKTQDFILFDSPAFFVGNPVQYVEFEDAILRAYGKSKVETVATTFLNYYWRHPRHLLNLLQTQKTGVIDPLAISYWSVTPYSLGKNAVKYKATPAPGGEVAVDAGRSENMLRASMKLRLGERDATYEFQVQPQIDPSKMPVEDPSVEWDEAASKPVTVALIKIAKQDFDEPERRRFAEQLSFTPWNGLEEHKPLGGINEVRKKVYESLSAFRHALNHVEKEETAPPSQP